MLYTLDVLTGNNFKAVDAERSGKMG